MNFSISLMKRTLTAMVAVAIVATALSAGPLGAVGAQNGDAPTPGADDDINCDEFDNREQIGEVFDPDDDEYGLDADGNDIACEGIGENPTPQEPSTETIGDTTTTETTTPEETDTTTTDTETETTVEDTDTEETTTEQDTTTAETGADTGEGKAKQPNDEEDTADGGNGKAKMGDSDDGDDTADGGNGKAKQD